MSDPLVVLRLSPAQARAAEEALDKLMLEAQLDDTTDASEDVIDRARHKLSTAMAAVDVASYTTREAVNVGDLLDQID